MLVLNSLHWLPIKSRIYFKITIITFRAIYGLATKYICNLVSIRKQSRYSLHSCSGLLLQPTTVKTKEDSGRSLIFSCGNKALE